MAKLKDLTGCRFSWLTVIGPVRNTDGKIVWRCQCDCGNIKDIWASRLNSGSSRSCGCMKANCDWSFLKNAKKTHGMCYSPEWRAWKGIKKRCRDHKDYAGRGIDMCDRWKEKFENFYADMGLRPTSKHTIERINNDLGYSPENCVWASRKDQQNNRRTNKIVTAFGITAALGHFFNSSAGRDYGNASYRIDAGWDVEHAITAPPQSRRR